MTTDTALRTTTSLQAASPGSASPRSGFGRQQEDALARVRAWLADGSGRAPVMRLFGYAGTGKTHLARHLASGIGGTVCFAAYTGKAALVLQRSGCPDATTIHSLIYRTRTRPDGSAEFVRNPSSPVARAKLVVIDECSMVDETVGQDLLSFGVPVLVLGDPAQLPPVKSAGFFTSEKPDVMLTEIHRQAKDNPIVRVATAIREGRSVPYGEYGTVVVGRRGERGAAEALEADQILVGLNATRSAFNAQIRRHLGRAGDLPEAADRLVGLRNDHDLGVFNGGLYEVADRPSIPSGGVIQMRVRPQDVAASPPVAVSVRRELFEGGMEDLSFREVRGTQHFDYGYALTTHKAQGSQWDHVLAYDESEVFGRDARRWLYTAVTRASERLTLIR